ncbi:biopolymer transporter ExbD [bacterium]|nr:biopolymer transporter ExbD [bacterium]
MATKRRHSLFPSAGQRRTPKVEIIPMVDVMFLLLVFYILSSLALHKQRGIAVDLPSAQSGTAAADKDEMVLSIKANGEFFVNKEAVTAEALQGVLHRWLLTRPGGLQSAEKTDIVLNVDAQAQHKHVVRAMDELRKEGLTHFVISTQPGAAHG